MEEEPNEHEIEERLYAMLHHVDETQATESADREGEGARSVEEAPRSTLRRYWRPGGDLNTPYQKVNSPREAPAPVKNPTPATKTQTNVNKNQTTNNTKPKEEKQEATVEPTVDLSLFQSPAQIYKKAVEILDHEDESVLLETSDEDEVMEVALPPKPTITIESSDEDEVCIISKPETPSKDNNKITAPGNATPNATDRAVSASPVPSVVSSVSDEFIRSDCIALNISSRHPDQHSFDFSLHGSDLLGQVTPAKKKKKKKSKEAVTSTPVNAPGEKPSNASPDTCFATPKSKAKNKKQKTKSYMVSEKSLPSADVYDSDSNQSAIESVKDQPIYSVNEKSVPSIDIYESDSSQPDNVINKRKPLADQPMDKSDSSIDLDKLDEDTTINSKANDTSAEYRTANSFVDLTGNDSYITLDSTGICENIVMANVTGFKESEDYGDDTIHIDAPKLGSTKVPQILFDNLDFDNLKGNDKVCKRRKYSLTTLRAEMEKFYNESWGGEDFNHREIQKYMSRDKSLWVIDPKDRMPALSKRKVTCNYCNRAGHRDESCRMKPPVCYMCGNTGHYEPRCPTKICVNCGSPNHMYSTMCRNCAGWGRVRCAECGQHGHPASHCPDVWRRYHNTISTNTPLMENRQTKKPNQLYCSGCTRRGHLVHTCRLSLPFSGLPINTPYVALYRPVYRPPSAQDDTVSSAGRPPEKRHSNSPATHEHIPKKKNISITEVGEPEKQKTNDNQTRQRKNSQGKLGKDKPKELRPETPKSQTTVEPAPDFIPITSTNRDKQGQMIQDNEVSDTSDVVTSARIYITNDIIDRLQTTEGGDWLREATQKHNVIVENTDITSFLSIKGKVADQEAFQGELRDWSKPRPRKDSAKSDNGREADVSVDDEGNQSFSVNIPKNRNNVLRKLNKAFESLKDDLGDPKDIYKELNYLQNRHEQLQKQKIVSPQQLTNNRTHINDMLKKLNMVLLGQAGLAEGSKHISELHSLHEKLTNYRHKNIPANLRKKIGQHYHSVFTAIPRDDYSELLNKYYVSFKGKALKRRYKEKFNLAAKKRKKQNRNINPVAVAQSFPSMNKNVMSNVVNNDVVGNVKTHSRKASEHITVGKLSFYHRRIMNARPADSGLKKTKLELARKLHSHITSLYRNENMSSKAMKKVKRIQEQAALFLSNV